MHYFYQLFSLIVTPTPTLTPTPTTTLTTTLTTPLTTGFYEEEDDYWLIFRYDGDSSFQYLEELLNHTPTPTPTSTSNGSTTSGSRMDHDTTSLPSSASTIIRLMSSLRTAFPEFSVLVGDELHRPLSATHTFNNKNTSHININSSSSSSCVCCRHSDHVSGNVGLLGGNVSGLGK